MTSNDGDNNSLPYMKWPEAPNGQKIFQKIMGFAKDFAIDRSSQFQDDYRVLKSEALQGRGMPVGPLLRMARLFGIWGLREILRDFAPISNSNERIIIRKRKKRESGGAKTERDRRWADSQRYEQFGRRVEALVAGGYGLDKAMQDAADQLEIETRDRSNLQKKLAAYRATKPPFEIDFIARTVRIAPAARKHPFKK